jgi:hypothetical protein
MTKTEREIVLVPLDNWIGLYIDGQIVFQGHSLPPSTLLDLLGIPYKVLDANEKFYFDEGSLPDRKEEVVR